MIENDEPNRNPKREKRLRRKILILPSIFTVGNIFCGFFAIVSGLRGDYDNAAKAIGWAWVCDVFDGRIARLTNTTSNFGLQLDSLADVISFGVAPTVLLMVWGFQPIELFGLGWVAAFVYLICGAMRLARFNTQVQNLKHFVGMPIPAGGTLIAAIVHFSYEPVANQTMAALIACLGFGLAFLMISTIRYPSLKFFSLTKGRSHLNILLLGLIIVAVYRYSQIVLLGLTSTYVASGLIMKLGSVFRRHRGVDSTHFHAIDSFSEEK